MAKKDYKVRSITLICDTKKDTLEGMLYRETKGEHRILIATDKMLVALQIKKDCVTAVTILDQHSNII